MKIQRIHFLRSVRHAGRQYTKGDVITPPDGLGDYFVHCGWAEDVSGQVPTGEAQTGDVTLEVHKSAHATNSEEIGNA